MLRPVRGGHAHAAEGRYHALIVRSVANFTGGEAAKNLWNFALLMTAWGQGLLTLTARPVYPRQLLTYRVARLGSLGPLTDSCSAAKFLSFDHFVDSNHERRRWL
jgi:hypothetical protein